MKNRNISFAQVLQGKSRSPQLKTETQPSASLQELFQDFQNYPNEDYTLYLGSFKSNKSKHSTVMFASKGNEDEEMFDSWIQRQSTVNANKENIIHQPKKQTNTNSPFKVNQQQPPKFAFNSKGSSKGNQDSKIRNVVSDRQPKLSFKPPQCQPKIDPRQFQNIGNNIKMIKSNTCEKEEFSQMRSPKRNEDISLDVLEVDFKKRMKSQEDEEIEDRCCYDNQQNRQKTQVYEMRVEFKPVLESEQKYLIAQNPKINQMIRQTDNIHTEIADLAKKYATQDQLLQSKQSNIEEEEEEQDDQLLIGNSERKKLLASDGIKQQRMFSEEYVEKTRQEQELQRKRRQQAKLKLNDLMKQYYNKPKPEYNILPARQQKVAQLELHDDGVGYSFASNPTQLCYQSAHKNIKIDNIQEIRSQLPSAASKMGSEIDDADFMKKYVKKESNDDIRNVGSLQQNINGSVREEQVKEVILPNQSNEVKFIKKEENILPNIIMTYQSKEIINVEPLKTSNQSNTGHHGIKVSLTQKNFLIQSHNQEENEITQNSFALDKTENQKTKNTFNQKLKVYSNSNKSSPSGSHSSHKRQNSIVGPEVKTQPFVVGQPEPQKVEFPKAEVQEFKEQNSPFEEINKVKDIIVNSVKPASPQLSYKTGSITHEKITTNFTVNTYTNNNINDYPYYAVPFNSNYSQNNGIKPLYNGNYAILTQKQNHLNLPTYGNSNKTLKSSNSFQSYKDNFNFTKTQYTKIETTINDKDHFERKVKESTFTYNPPTYQTKKEGRRSILTELDLKQSINVDEVKPIRVEEPKREEVKGLLDKELKQSLKESIDLKTSSEFTFDF